MSAAIVTAVSSPAGLMSSPTPPKTSSVLLAALLKIRYVCPKLTDDNNYKKEISIPRDHNWDPVINQLREFRSIQRNRKSSPQQG